MWYTYNKIKEVCHQTGKYENAWKTYDYGSVTYDWLKAKTF